MLLMRFTMQFKRQLKREAFQKAVQEVWIAHKEKWDQILTHSRNASGKKRIARSSNSINEPAAKRARLHA
jgi:hypothetical protein